jgi:leucyl/phenylalanyl-tRNA--protein transferase
MIDARDLLRAYTEGEFPMADSVTGDIYWHLPRARGIIPLDDRFIVPSNLRRKYNKKPFRLTINQAFEQVIKSCRDLRINQTWINQEIIESYLELFRIGYAHSFEAWQDDELVGGLYGVALGKAFFGESMFSRATDASKICLVFLVERLRQKQFQLLDTQYLNPHLKQFGAYEVSSEEFEVLLSKALAGFHKPW